MRCVGVTLHILIKLCCAIIAYKSSSDITMFINWEGFTIYINQSINQSINKMKMGCTNFQNNLSFLHPFKNLKNYLRNFKCYVSCLF